MTSMGDGQSRAARLAAAAAALGAGEPILALHTVRPERGVLFSGAGSRRSVPTSRREWRADQAGSRTWVRIERVRAPILYTSLGCERARTGHLSENAAGLAWATPASGEGEGPDGISLDLGIGQGEGGDDEKEVAPAGLPRGRKGGSLGVMLTNGMSHEPAVAPRGGKACFHLGPASPRSGTM